MACEIVEGDLTICCGESGVLLCRRHALNAAPDYGRRQQMTTRKRSGEVVGKLIR